MKDIIQGNEIRASVTFKNVKGKLADPTTVVARVEDPDGAVTTPAVVHTTIGVYYADVLLSVPGLWQVRLAGTGAVKAAAQEDVNCVAARPPDAL